jgi:hypothetical protein
MKTNHNNGFDEVMIVNPYDPTTNYGQGEIIMPYHYGDQSTMGYYGDDAFVQPDLRGYGEPAYYPEPERAYGDYGTVGYYGEPYGYYGGSYGYYAQSPYGDDYGAVGYYGEPYGYYGGSYGYYAQSPYGDDYGAVGYADVPGVVDGYYSQPEAVGYYADERLYGYYGDPYNPNEHIGYYGYGADPVEFPGVESYADAPLEGYVRDQPSHFNAGCPMPSNVSGYGDAEHLEGYIRPAEVSPSCAQLTPQPGGTPSVPETFRALWD